MKALLLISVAVFGGLYAAGLRVNTSPSIPVGVYRLTDEAITRGRYVLLCPPDTPLFQEAKRRGYVPAGFCPGNLGYLMKQVAATAGDVVSHTPEGLNVNGVLLPASRELPFDGAQRPLPHWEPSHYPLKDDELLLMTDQSALSFDARYFGVLRQQQVRHVITPVLVWRKTNEAPS
ncbi:conjugal transfer peptidase TraF [Legionella geestiana]|uniref:Conjugal transfer peptidase TraF n=1 Tax=Legionella geestiana TaxID=45065 RepID=A0A0W0U7Q1_9GAMM|nr:conjugative transfer signal peptidase TraF [Legionella geestiana]KTD03693.1 conjugal transfer peptidase TraF [Legionella geestiana]QBS11535.1 conjugative transfer signal peptidase TraF [Legionella geestiana]STX53795.1 conjugal transfer protein [Legionella geestiana]